MFQVLRPLRSPYLAAFSEEAGYVATYLNEVE